MPSPNIPDQLRGLWVGFTAYKSTHLSPNTINTTYAGKERLLKQIPIYCSTAQDIIDWLEKNRSTETNRRFVEGAIACYDWAIRTERVKSNPFKKYDRYFPRKRKSEIQAFTHEERDAILHAFHLQSPHYYPYINFCFRTGCRHEEARGLEWEGIKKDYIHFYQAIAPKFTEPTPTKTGVTRKFPLTPKLRDIIEQQRGLSNRWLFPSLEDTPIDYQKVLNNHWTPIVKGLEKKGLIAQYLPPRHTRHTFITLLLKQNKNVIDIAKLVGNSADTIWRHYAAASVDIEVEDF